MAEYNFREIEKKWQKHWAENDLYKTGFDPDKPKFYVLDMFPYPSGAGLHVGHPLGYIATDIVSRFKRSTGFNVLHPMGFDAFGLPAEQYAIQTGQHPAITTEENINRYKDQLKNMGFSFDWSREVQTSDPAFYRWTQWIFSQLFDHWYDNGSNKAQPISVLEESFQKEGNGEVNAACDDDTPSFSAEEWNSYSDKEKSDVLNKYRLTYHAEAVVNWCPALGTVLANDEVKDGFSERGGYPVERKKMKQWMMRITAYADRLLNNLRNLDWSTSMKEMQTNWIGKSEGCELTFEVVDSDIKLTAFTTRPDTIYGVTYMVIAPEHELVPELTTDENREHVEQYVAKAINRSERERMAETKTVTGVFTGSYVTNPFTNEKVELWVADYVLAGYGTGVVMAVPSSDDRDFRFATEFNLPVTRVIDGTQELDDPTEIKHGKMINSGILDGMDSGDAIGHIIKEIESRGIGVAKVNFKIRDAVFSRQRYWGEPVPVYFENGIPKLVPDEELPLILPNVDEYKPTETGEPPLARATTWRYNGEFEYETTTMPGWAGSSWYFLRYMDATNEEEFVKRELVDYWNQVDLYIGGTEHATGHLLYSRFWNLFLYDVDFISHEEPFQKLVNQGMIQGRSSIAYRLKDSNKFVSYGLKDQYKTVPIHVDVSMVSNDELDTEAFKSWRPDLNDAEFELEGGVFKCGWEIEKMSKRLYNVVNPDDIINDYGADTLRLYEMFLGPLEQAKPWDTNGIDGVYRFLKKLWNLYHNSSGEVELSDDEPTAEELKVLHKTIKKSREDIDKLSFNTSVSSFMICVNELSNLKCNKRAILKDLLIVIAPFAPHITEELWEGIGETSSVVVQSYPDYNASFIQESSHEYPIMINGKLRTKIEFALDAEQKFMQDETLKSEVVQKWLEGKDPKKIIIVPKRIINIVV